MFSMYCCIGEYHNVPAPLYQHWTKISKPISLAASVRSLEWPEERYGHAATCVSGPLLVIMGGVDNRIETISDCWIYDFTAMLWKKVHACFDVFQKWF